ncbi:DUF4214 domain-containing protein [uncultured Roseobacter sp.]|uniref:DUF4214 domain-containing protein n=1 Tax=uncultured Roseobacter sp. TaxID=114847 RepID=UPI0026187441|nr:DUF4214 domain-containing protein [uncultured Roseobacter sp.]
MTDENENKINLDFSGIESLGWSFVGETTFNSTTAHSSNKAFPDPALGKVGRYGGPAFTAAVELPEIVSAVTIGDTSEAIKQSYGLLGAVYGAAKGAGALFSLGAQTGHPAIAIGAGIVGGVGGGFLGETAVENAIEGITGAFATVNEAHTNIPQGVLQRAKAQLPGAPDYDYVKAVESGVPSKIASTASNLAGVYADAILRDLALGRVSSEKAANSGNGPSYDAPGRPGPIDRLGSPVGPAVNGTKTNHSLPSKSGYASPGVNDLSPLDQLAELGRIVDSSPPPIVYGPIYPVDTYPKIGPQFLPSPTNVSFPDVDSLAGSYGFGSGFAGWLSKVFGAAKPNHLGKSFDPSDVKNALQKGLVDEEAVVDAVVAETGVPRQKAHDALDAQRGYGTRSRSEREASHDSSGRESGHSASRGEYRPVIFDLDGNGISITELSKSTVFMDAGGDGLLHRTAWAGAGDAVLFIDDDGDGAISEKKEYVFTEWDPTATDDLAALRAVFDSNDDGVLDASDARFADFKVLVTNPDGSTTAKTLVELGITSIDLTADTTQIELPDGSMITGQTTFTRSDGTTGTVANATLVAEAQGYRVEQAESTDGSGNRVVVSTAYAADGDVAYVITSVTSPDGSNIANSYDDNGDGVVDRLQVITTVTDGSGNKIETVVNKAGSDTVTAILVSRIVTTTSADGADVTIQRDSTGGGWFDQEEIRTTNIDGSRSIVINDLADDGSVIRGSSETTAIDGLTRTQGTDEDGDGVDDLTVTHRITEHGDGSRTESTVARNRDGSLRSSETMVVGADGQSKIISRDLDGDGVFETVEDLSITLDASGNSTSVLNVNNTTAISLVLDTLETGKFGNKFDGQTDADGVITAGFQNIGRDLRLTFNGFDVDFTNEVELFLNGASLGFLAPGADEQLTEYTIDIAASDMIAGENVITFDQARNDTWKWGVTDLLLREVDTSPPPPSTADISLALDTLETGKFGNKFDGQTDADGVITAGFQNVGRDLRLTFNGFDIDFDNEVKLFLNGNSLGFIAAGVNDGLTEYTIDIAASDMIAGENVITFDQARNDTWKWGVTDLLLSEVPLSPAASSDASDGSLRSSVTQTQSADALTKTIASDADGDGDTDTTTVDATVIHGDGSRENTITVTNTDGSVRSMEKTTLGADKVSSETWVDLDQDGIFDADERVRSITVDGTTQDRTTLDQSRAADGTVLASSTTVSSEDGLTLSSTTDADGDSDVDTAVSDITAVDGSGVSTRTVETRNQDGTLRSKTVVETSADGLTTTTQVDSDGNGAFDSQTVDVRVLETDGSITRTVSSYAGDGTTLLSKVTTTESADRRVKTTTQDTDGDGIADVVMTSTEASDGSMVVTEVQNNTDGSKIASSQTSISANGLVSTTESDLDGDDVTDVVTEATTVLEADGSRATTTIVKNGDLSTRSKTVSTVSDDGLTVRVQRDAEGNGSFERDETSTTVLNTDGSQTTTTALRAANGDLLSQSRVKTDDDNLITVSSSDNDGDGTFDLISTTTTVLQDDGGTSTTSALRDTAGALRNASTTTSNDNGRNIATITDVNGDGVDDMITSRIIADDGVLTQTQSEWGMDDLGAAVLQSRTETTTSANGLTTTSKVDADGDGTFERAQESIIVLYGDGSQTTTVTEKDANGTVYRTSSSEISDDGRTRTETWDENADGTDDLTTLTMLDLSLDGIETITTERRSADTFLLSKTTMATSADGRMVTRTTDLDGDDLNDIEVSQIRDVSGTTTSNTRHYSIDHALEASVRITVSDDALETVTYSDRDGDGTFEVITTDLTEYAQNGAMTRTLSHKDDGGSLLAREVYLVSDDGLFARSELDMDGDGIIDLRTEDTTTYLNNGDVSRVQETVDGQSNPFSTSTWTTSGSELSTTFSNDFNGDGTTNRLIATVRGADGGSTENTSEYGTDGSLIRTSSHIVSADGWSETFTLDRDGDGNTDREVFRTTDASRDLTVEYKDVPPVGLSGAEIVETASFNRMSGKTKFDLDGDGAFDVILSSQSTYDAAGNRIDTFSETMGQNHLTYEEVTTTAANGLSSSMTFDMDGDGVLDGSSQSTTTLNADGSRQTVSETHYAGGALRSSNTVTISRDGRTTTETFDFDGNGKINMLEERFVASSGAETVTEIGYNDDGDETNRIVTTTTSDGLLTTILRNGVEQTIARSVTGNGTYTWDNGVNIAGGDDHYLVAHTVDAAEMETWSATKTWEKASGSTQTEVYSIRLDQPSIARLTDEAVRLYDTLLDRDMQREEFEVLVQYVANGELDKGALATALMSSDEFSTRYGTLTDAGFVTQMYLNSFGRAPSLGELDKHLRQLDAGGDRNDLAAELAESIEHLVVGNGHRITNNFDVEVNPAEYERILDRAYVAMVIKDLVDVAYDRDATAHEIDYLSSLLLEGTDDVAAVAQKLLDLDGDIQGVSSNSLKGLTGANFVDQAFLNALGRLPSAVEAQIWQENLSTGRITQAQFVAAMAQSVEHLGYGNQYDTTSTPTISTITGNGSANTLTGASGQDDLKGLGGDDRLIGNGGADRLEGGTGNRDGLLGGTGSDTYIWSRGDGNDTINDEGTSMIEVDMLHLTDVAASDVTLRRDYASDTMFITIAGTGGAVITVAYQFDETESGGAGLESILFADGTIWTAMEIDKRVVMQGAANNASQIIYGVANDDTINGGGGNDWIDGGDGNDNLFGNEGADTVLGGEGNDTIWSGSDNDQVYGGSGDDDLSGNSGNDQIWGDDGSDQIHGNDGQDTLHGGSGDDHLFGGGGVDILYGNSGDDVLDGGGNADVLDGGEGFDKARYQTSSAAVIVDLAAGSGTQGFAQGDTYTSIEGVIGSQYSDQIYGDDGDNVIDGLKGNDVAYGGAGDDRIWLGEGADRGEGGAGDDNLYGYDGNDMLYGGIGDDVLVGQNGEDSLFGEAGNDVIRAGNDDDFVSGGSGDDNVHGGRGNDEIWLGNGADSGTGGTGNDQVYGEAGDDRFWGNEGNDELNGGDGDDLLYGEEGEDTLTGGAGNDILRAGKDNDVADGGEGSDTIFGGDGNDRLIGGLGNDTLKGGEGSDVFVSQSGDGADIIEDFDVNTDKLELTGITGTLHVLDLENAAQVLIDDTTSIYLEGVNAQTLTADNFIVSGGLTLNTIEFEIDVTGYSAKIGTVGGGQIFGTNGSDFLIGSTATDDMRGFDGDDLLVDGAGSERLSGGNGSDYFKLVADGELDRITDFSVGVDTIDISDWGVTSFSELSLWVLYAGDGAWRGRSYVDFGSESIRLDNFDQAAIDSLTSDDFVFAPELVVTPASVITGTSGRDTLYGGAGDDTIDGLEDHDLLYGGAGNDVLTAASGNNDFYGEAGNDTITGGSGRDDLYGGVGDDILTGGLNGDKFGFEAGDGDDTITDYNVLNDTLVIDGIIISGPDGAANGVSMVQSGSDVLVTYAVSDSILIEDVLITDWQNMEKQNIQGTAIGELIEGRDNDDDLYGNGGGDTLLGHGGKDDLYGGDGNDTLDGGANNDKLYGDAGDDTLTDTSGHNAFWGGTGDDVITGGGGHDDLTGGSGNDTMTGGLGRDTFVFSDGFGSDIITDFAEHETTERISLIGVSEIVDWNDLVQNHLSQVGVDVVIDDGLGNTITLQNEVIANFTADEFLF